MRKILIGLIMLSFFNIRTMAQTDSTIKSVEVVVETLDDPPVYDLVDLMPEFIDFTGENTEQRLEGFIQSKLQWPSQKCTGRVFVKAIIETDGTLSNPIIIRGMDSCIGFNEEALRVVKLLPRWKPGKLNGKLVRVYYIIPVKFSIQN